MGRNKGEFPCKIKPGPQDIQMKYSNIQRWHHCYVHKHFFNSQKLVFQKP